MGDAAKTLGDLLYSGTRRAPVAEARWIELVRLIAAGDQQALRALYDQTHRIVYTLAVRITDNRETAEEVTVDVFHDVWRRSGTYDAAGGSVVGWIMNQARSRALDRLRFEHRKKRVNTSAETPATAPAPRDPLTLVNVQEQAQILRAALKSLTPDEQEAIETAFFAELTYPEVAARLRQPLGTVKTRIRSGLAKLRHALGASKGI